MRRQDDGSLKDAVHNESPHGYTLLNGTNLNAAKLKGLRAQNAVFSDANLSHADLENANLESANFDGANLSDSNLKGAILNYASMDNTLIAGAVMHGTQKMGLNLTKAFQEQQMGKRLDELEKPLQRLIEDHVSWVKTAGKSGNQLNISGYDMRDARDLHTHNLTAVHAVQSTFIKQDLRGACLQSALLDKSDFRDCDLRNADMRAAKLRGTVFTRAKLAGADLSALEIKKRDGTNRIIKTDLTGADLRYTDLTVIDLRHAILVNADLRHARLNNADLSHADLTGANIDGASWMEQTRARYFKHQKIVHVLSHSKRPFY